MSVEESDIHIADSVVQDESIHDSIVQGNNSTNILIISNSDFDGESMSNSIKEHYMFGQINKSRDLMGTFASLLRGALSSYDKQYAPIFSADEFESQLDRYPSIFSKPLANGDLLDKIFLYGLVAVFLILNIGTLLGDSFGLLNDINQGMESENHISALGLILVGAFVFMPLAVFGFSASYAANVVAHRMNKLKILKKVISDHDEWKARVVPTLEKAHRDSEFISLGQEFQSGESVFQLCGFIQQNRHVILLRRVQKGSAHSMSDWVVNNMKWGLVAVTMDEFAKIYVGDDLSMDDQSWARRSIRYTPD